MKRTAYARFDSLAGLLASEPPAVIFSCRAGSHAYGTAHEHSDEDLRGVFALPAARYLELAEPPRQIADEKNNTIYYSLRRFIELASNANPSILELLYMPADCIFERRAAMDCVLAQRRLFITRRAYDSHVEYASAQIARARGRNKWVNNPQPEAPPTHEPFCWIIPQKESRTPYRPIPLAQSGVDLSMCRAAALEHAPDLFRLYHYPEVSDGKEAAARGVFRGGNVVCSSIPVEDEARRCIGLLIYNRTAHEHALRDHKHYWQWRGARNQTRWLSQESGERDYDAKNMMHTFRLLLSGEHILREGEPLVRVQGEHLHFLRRVLAGEYAYDTLIGLAEERVQALAELRDRSSLPDHPDAAAVAELLTAATSCWEEGHGS